MPTTTDKSFADDLREQWGEEDFEGTMRDLARGGADAGWPGLTYYTDTTAMYDKHEDEIWDALIDEAEDFGYANVFAFVATFNTAKNVGDTTQFKNLLCWYMAERVAREFDE